MAQLILFLALLIWFYGGSIIAYKQFGQTVSISRNYYEIMLKYPGKQWIFTFWFIVLMVLVILNLVPLLEGKWFQFLGFFAAIGLGMVGIFPKYLEKSQRVKHYIGACISASCIIAISYFSGQYWLILVTLPLALTLSKETKELDITYWVEQGAFLIGFIFMGINL